MNTISMPDINEIISKFEKAPSDTGKYDKMVADVLQKVCCDKDIYNGLAVLKRLSVYIESVGLQLNPATSEKDYEQFLLPYKDGRNYRKAKKLGLNNEIADDVGRKIHLNVAPIHAKAVSEYLTEGGYSHKFLSGGDVDDGKIFTIYIGSYDLAKKVAEVISNDIGDLLCMPLPDSLDIEFARGVVGRFFDIRTKGMIRSGYHGFQQYRGEKSEKNFQISFMYFKNTYGEYFFPSKPSVV